jgi:hypothetical protein
LAFRFLASTAPKTNLISKPLVTSQGLPKKGPQAYGTATMVEEKPVVATLKTPLEETVTAEGLLAEEYLMLHKKAEELGLKEIACRMEEIRKKLLASIPENMDPATEVSFCCESGMVQFSPCGTSVEVTQKAQLLDYLSEKGFDVVGLIKLQMTDLKKILSEKELEPFIKEKPGSRTIKAIHSPW